LIDSFDWRKFIDPFKPCPNCIEGFVISETEAHECSCRSTYLKNLRYVMGLIQSNLVAENSSIENVENIKNYSFNDYGGPDESGNLKKLKSFIKNFDSKYSSTNLFFSGSPGTQKTTVAKHIASELIKNRKTCYYILANTLIEYINDAQRKPDAEQLIESLLNKDFLIIDEMDEQKIITYGSGWQRKLLFPFLKERMESVRKSTLFISNQDISNIGNYFEGAIQDLIEREVPDPMYFNDKYFLFKKKLDVSKLWDDED